MEEKELGLFDYLLIIWKRKVSIIVVTLVCLLIGVLIALSRPDLYRASVLVRIGKGQTTNIPTLLDEPKNLVTTIPIEYSRELGTGYGLFVEMLSGTPLIRINVQGPEGKKAKEYLNNVVGLFVESHRKRSEELIESYRVLASGIGKYIEATGEQIAQFGVSEKEVSAIKKGGSVDYRTVNDLWSRNDSLIDIKRKSESKMFINSLRTNMTQMVGSIKEAEPVKIAMFKYAIIASLFGLTISIIIVFLVEYVLNVKEQRKKQV